MGGGEEEGSLGHLCSCSFVSLKYHHPTYLLGKHLLVLQPSPARETFLSPLTARQKCSPLCIPILPLQTLSPALTTRDHAYLFANHNNNAHDSLLPAGHCSGHFTCTVSFNPHHSLLQSTSFLSPFTRKLRHKQVR